MDGKSNPSPKQGLSVRLDGSRQSLPFPGPRHAIRLGDATENLLTLQASLNRGDPPSAGSQSGK
jgi:hypothetical protein